MRNVPTGTPSISRKFLTKPSSLRSFTTSSFSFDIGTSSRSCLAICALRIRLSKSAMGSVMLIAVSPRLPARLDDARQIALEGQAPQVNAAQPKLPVDPARASAEPAPVAVPHLEFQLLSLFRYFR